MPLSGRRMVMAGIAYFLSRFGSIILLGAVPAAIVIASNAALSYLQSSQIVTAIQQARAGAQAADFTPSGGITLLVFLILLAASVWFSAIVYRMRLGEEFPVTRSLPSAALSLLGYSALFGLILIILLLLGAIALTAALFGIYGLPVVESGAPNPLFVETLQQQPWGAIALAGLGLIGFVYLIYAGTRFGLGLPGIAIGHRLHILRDIWPLARPVAWSLAGWNLLIGVIFVGVIALAAYLLSGASLSDPQAFVQTISSDPGGYVASETLNGAVSGALSILLSGLIGSIASEAYAQLTKAKAGGAGLGGYSAPA